MPQHSMFPGDAQPFCGLMLVLEDLTSELHDAHRVSLRLRDLDTDWVTIESQHWTGLMRDVLAGSCEDVVSSWLWGVRNDPIRQFQHQHRLAQRHAKQYRRH